MKRVGTQLTMYSFLPKRDINKPDGGEDEYPTHIHTEQHSMDDSVLEINSSANEIIHGRFFMFIFLNTELNLRTKFHNI